MRKELIKQVSESMQTCLLEDKTTISEHFAKPCPEQQDALSPQSKGEALLEIPCHLISLVSQTIFLALIRSLQNCGVVCSNCRTSPGNGAPGDQNVPSPQEQGALRLKGQRLFWSMAPQSAVVRHAFIYP